MSLKMASLFADGSWFWVELVKQAEGHKVDK
jgi:hypothetical protein